MVNYKKLITMARKWHKLAAMGRIRISSPTADMQRDADKCSKLVASKGHFVVYTSDKRRFVIPLAYLSNPIFIELLRISEEEFGLPSDGPITLLCTADFVEKIINLMQRHPSKDLEKAVLAFLTTCRCSLSSPLFQESNNPPTLLLDFKANFVTNGDRISN
ncbi:PREDICTED: auxin-responsive protein SAUR64-like [Nelumbo nucifera]|uniref:Auxin-responsive protein SAUR64-like n=1 Tax=Nelumbo nucifera TaxID=4432 RepID=A0A1U7Z7E5_NELNU|nr:PREDICTED: auxin-responsive protein SAUR64-like [Nelumbo nucifera]